MTFTRAWPYVSDFRSIQAMRSDKPFELATCWHGAVALKAEPFLYPAENPVARYRSNNVTDEEALPDRHQAGKRWEMIDDRQFTFAVDGPRVVHPSLLHVWYMTD